MQLGLVPVLVGPGFAPVGQMLAGPGPGFAPVGPILAGPGVGRFAKAAGVT